MRSSRSLLTPQRLEHGSGLDERACLRTISLSLSEKVACAVPEQPRPIGRHAAVGTVEPVLVERCVDPLFVAFSRIDRTATFGTPSSFLSAIGTKTSAMLS